MAFTMAEKNKIYTEYAKRYRKANKSIGNPPALPGDSKSLTFQGI
jgi:hypothetical protein